jgi:hypothetical protein
MPRSRTRAHSRSPNHAGPLKRFRCPVETCRRLLKSQSGWTKHIQSAHANVDLRRYGNESPKVMVTRNLRGDQPLPSQGSQLPRSSYENPSLHSSPVMSSLHSSPMTSPTQPSRVQQVENDNLYFNNNEILNFLEDSFPPDTNFISRSSPPPVFPSSPLRSGLPWDRMEFHPVINGIIPFRTSLNVVLMTYRYTMR